MAIIAAASAAPNMALDLGDIPDPSPVVLLGP
jgi:hypothetical protein